MTIKNFFRITIVTVLLCLLPGLASANPLVVFFGDSITNNWGIYRGPFFSANNFICKGVSGETTGSMLKRYASDVIDQHPQAVVILAGTNDIAQKDGVHVTAEQISSNIFLMAKMAQGAGIKVVLCSLLPSSGYGLIPTLNTIIEEWAVNNNCEYVDYYSMFVQADGSLDPKFTTDNCHLVAEGYYIMEQAIMPILESMLNK